MKQNFLYALLLFLCPVIYGFDETERIINFHSNIVIDTSGVIRVTETIQAYVGGNDIKRGIVRSIPLYRKDMYDKKIKVKTDIISIFCNGREENFKIENTSDYKEIYIGNPNNLLKPGIYQYTIIYESGGQIGFFDDYDELYWNVTGNDWVFRIEQASASITLPNNVQSISASCYTGYLDSNEMSCSSEDTGNTVIFTSNRYLSAKEGFTVAVSFPRDIVSRPPPPTGLALFWEEYKHPVSALICLLIFAIFFYVTWRKVGKDPEKPVVIPTFKPPHGRSPAATRYLFKRRYDDKVFTAALVGMAVKKAIRISNRDKQFSLEAVERKENLNEEENEIYDTLFANNQNIAVTDKNHSIFAKVNENLTKTLQVNWTLKHYFLANLKYIAWGTALLPALIFLYVILTENLSPEATILLTVPLLCLTVILMTLKKFGKSCLVYFFKITGLIVFGFFTLGACMLVLIVVITSLKENWTPGLFILGLFILYGIYIYLIKAPTKLGAQTAAELEGFKMYLETAEEHRLNLLTPPEKTPELFEKLLPYAIALGVENKWGEKFTDVLKKSNYQPDWYDNNKQPFTSSGLTSTFARSFTSSVSSARINPASSSSSGGSWSSGSSGGGSSGRGGGGGGGRGW